MRLGLVFLTFRAAALASATIVMAMSNSPFRAVLTGIGMACVALAAAGVASGQGLGLGVSASQDLYYPGDRLELSVSATNTGVPAVADFYTGVILPDGVTIATVGPGGSARLGTLATPAAFVPLATNVSLAGPFSTAVDPLFQYVWTGSEPIGDYTIFLLAVRAGGFADNRIDGGDILALQTGGLHVRARAQFTVESGGAVTVPITPEEGGTLAVTSAAGTAFTLTLPPGAVAEETTITATPVASATGLPLDRLIGAVRFEPDGLQLRAPATLTVTLPPSLLPLGTVGFTAKDDGTGFETVPVTIADGVETIRLAHFSTAGIGQSMCGATVTSAVGRDACRRMREDLAIAGEIIAEGSGGTPLPVRVLLAAEITHELRTWLDVGIRPFIEFDLSSGAATRQHFFMVGLRELDAVKAILQLTAALDINAGLASEIVALDAQITAKISVLRMTANVQCLGDKPNYRFWLRRLFELAGESHERGLPVDNDTQGITCVEMEVIPVLPEVVPVDGARFIGEAKVEFSDGGFLPDSPVVTIELVENGRARLSNPTFAQGPNFARLDTIVAPRENDLRFEVRGKVPALGLSKYVTVRRSVRPWTLSTFEARFTRSLIAGTQVSSGNFFHRERVELPDEQLSDGGATAAMTNARGRRCRRPSPATTWTSTQPGVSTCRQQGRCRTGAARNLKPVLA